MKRETCIGEKVLLLVFIALSSSFFKVFAFSTLPLPLGQLSIQRGSPSTRHAPRQVESPTKSLFSFSPFELNFYLPDEETLEHTLQQDNEKDSLSTGPVAEKVVLGLYRSQEDTVLCAADAQTGQILMAHSNERRIRQKNTLGDTKQFVEDCLTQLGLGLDTIETVVEHVDLERNHPSNGEPSVDTKWEKWLASSGAGAPGCRKQENVTLLAPERMGLSCHLAQAYATASQAPFDSGLIVVMDHKGDSFRSMWQTQQAATTANLSYSVNDFLLDPSVPCQPKNIHDKGLLSDWKEAESVYTFCKNNAILDIQPMFKRFAPSAALPLWASQQDQINQKPSLGDVCSDAAKYIFGGINPVSNMRKVGDLVPWMQGIWGGQRITPIVDPILSGDLHEDMTETPLTYRSDVFFDTPLIDQMEENKEVTLESEPFDFESDTSLDEGFVSNRALQEDTSEFVNKTKASPQPRGPTGLEVDAIRLAHRIQLDIETIASQFVKYFKKATGENNICIAGSVACNAGLVRHLQREHGLPNTFVAPDTSEDALAIGCSAFGLFGARKRQKRKQSSPVCWKTPLPPFLGPSYSEQAIRAALDEASPWINIEYCGGQEDLLEAASEELEIGGVVAWFQGSSELGARSFGHRSILASPSKRGVMRHLNERVRQRELFRPFRASVLVDHVDQWFHTENGAVREDSFVDATLKVKEEKKELIPAVIQPDASTRVQKVSLKSDPPFYNLLQEFYQTTGLPLLLHTSFRTRSGEPLVETPRDAIGSFLASEGAIDVLVLGDYIVRRRHPDLQSLVGDTLTARPVSPVCAGPVKVQTITTYERSPTDEVATTTTKACMPGCLTHNPNDEWVTLSDEMEGSLLRYCDGTRTLQSIMSKFTTKDDLELLTDAEAQELGQRVIRSLVKMYYLTLISW
eukprot:Nitzschia sp. Nitz4//scaffold62_size106224//45777//48521//NITZ4_004356-RA/size106224-processed-gene-0.53-mRNA-1//-1//CDS//3329555856//5424//frame0